MSRARAAVAVAGGLAIVVLGSMGGDHRPAAAESPAPPTTIVAPPPSTAVSPPTSVGGATGPGPVAPAPTTTTTPTTVAPRGGASSGSVAKSEDEQLNVTQMVTVTALGVVALAASGFVYGRIRSTPPRHPDLARTTE